MEFLRRFRSAVLVLVVAGVAWTVAASVGLEKLRSERAYTVFKRLAAGDPSIGTAIERDFAAGFPLSAELRAIKGWVDFSIFRISPVTDVHVGNEEWLFYGPELDDYDKRACGEAESMRTLAKDLQRIEQIVESSGRRFFLIVAPNKSTIYPEHVGRSRPLSCGKSRYDLLLESLREYPVANFIRLDDRLLDKKTRAQVYYRSDTHWNPDGAGILVDELLARILGQGAPPPPAHSPFTNYADLGTMMGLALPETTVAAILPDAPGRFPIETYGSPPIKHVRGLNLPSDPLPKIPPTVIYHDSFMTLPFFLLAGRFEQLDGYWALGDDKPIPSPGSEEAMRRARLVIIEIVERDLDAVELSPDTFETLLTRFR